MAHQNPSGYWEYQGKYLILLTDEALTDNVPRNAYVSGHAVRVDHGRIKQSMGGIQFYAMEQPFAWNYKFIKEIRDSNNDLIWQNWDYRQ